ncbi:MAG TPA: thiopurine S-methyltransferase [Kofleriaceae bacterium]|nr:thiopurine S-methyltransferase [Kofleriaceae bacterium]
MQEEWLARWRDGRIAFHEGRPNALLEHHVARLAGCRRVLVPLCGKSEDLALLAAHGHDVVGVELAEQAVQAFFDAHALVPAVTVRGPLVEYRAGAVTLLAGDLFATTPELVGPIDALYDRAALVALPPALRPRYVEQVRTLVAGGGAGLVITLEYDQSLMTGPPFAVLEAELRALYAGASVELVEDRPFSGEGKCTQSGVSATERCFWVRLDERR